MLLDSDGDGRVTLPDLKAWYMGARHIQLAQHGGGTIDAIGLAKQENQEAQEEEGDGNEALTHASSGQAGKEKDEISHVYAALQSHPPVISIAATLGGLCLIGAGFAGWFDAWVHFGDRASAFGEVVACSYCILIGFYSCLLENAKCVKSISYIDNIRLRAEAAASFLRFLWGRGVLYLTGGLLMCCMTETSESIRTSFVVLGIYMGLVGIVCIAFGLRLQNNLSALKDAIESEADLEGKWNECELDEAGEMSQEEFSKFLEKLNPSEEGLPLSDVELAATIQELDIDNNGKISLEEFKLWWRSRLVVLPGLMDKNEVKA